MQIILHGKFAADYGHSHTIQAMSIRDAIEGLTRQLGFYEDRMLDNRPVARIVGYNTPESLQECPDEIHVIPAVSGGKGVGKVLIGAALIGLAVINPVIGGMVLSQAGVSLLLGIGVSLALSGLSQIFIKAPSLSQESDPDASKYLGLSNNTTKLGTLRSYSMGRVKITAPHLLALNVDSNDLVRGEFPA